MFDVFPGTTENGIDVLLANGGRSFRNVRCPWCAEKLGIDHHPHVVGASGMSADHAFSPLGSGHHFVAAGDQECSVHCRPSDTDISRGVFRKGYLCGVERSISVIVDHSGWTSVATLSTKK